jgi:hypothetical protein
MSGYLRIPRFAGYARFATSVARVLKHASLPASLGCSVSTHMRTFSAGS